MKQTIFTITENTPLTATVYKMVLAGDTAGITSLVLGADTPQQVKENIAYFDAPCLSESVMATLRKEFAFVDIPEIMKVLSRPKPQN